MPAPTGKFSKDVVNKETDARFWAQSKYKPGQPLHPDDPLDKAMMPLWAHVFAEVKKENDQGKLILTYNHPKVEEHLDAAEISSHAAQGHLDAARAEPDPQKAQAHHAAADDLLHAAARAAHAAADLQPPSISPHVAEVAAHDAARAIGAPPPRTIMDKIPADHPANTHPASTPHFDITVQYPIDPHADAWRPRRHRIQQHLQPHRITRTHDASTRPAPLGRGRVTTPSIAPSIAAPLILQSQIPAPGFGPPLPFTQPPFPQPQPTPSPLDFGGAPPTSTFPQPTPNPWDFGGAPPTSTFPQPTPSPWDFGGAPPTSAFHPDLPPDLPSNLHPDADPLPNMTGPAMGPAIGPAMGPAVGPTGTMAPSTPHPTDVAIAQATTAHEHAVEVHERAAERAAQGAPPPTSTVPPDDMAQIRSGASKLAQARREPSIGIISDANGKWSTQGFNNASQARDWYVHNTDHPDTFAYAAYFDRTSAKWPAPEEDLAGSSQALGNAAGASQAAANDDSSNDNLFIYGGLAVIGALIIGSKDKPDRQDSRSGRGARP